MKQLDMPVNVREKEIAYACYDYHVSAEFPVRAYAVSGRASAQTKPAYDFHSALELGLLLDGSVRRFWEGGTQKDLHPGDVWFCKSYERHGYLALSSPNPGIVLVIWPELLSSMSFPESPRIDWMEPFTLPPEDRPSMPDHVKEEAIMLGRRIGAYARAEESNRIPSPLARVFLMEIMSLLLVASQVADRQPFKATIGPGPGKVSTVHARVLPAIDMVLQSKRSIKINEAARLCKMSRDKFLVQFAKATGTTFGQFGIRHRAQGAAADLRANEKPIKAIAADWGFTDGSHLCKIFEKVFNCSPLEYREGNNQ